MNNAKDLLLKAKEKDEMIECLLGNGEYNTSNRFEPSHVNENRILFGVQDAINADSSIAVCFENALCKMLETGAETFFIGFRYIVFYIDLKSKNKIEFSLDIPRLSKIANNYICVYETQLKRIDSIPQIAFKGNAYERLYSLNAITRKEYDITLLDDKGIIRSSEIFKKLTQTVLNGVKIPHNISQPVIFHEDGKFYLAVFVFFYSKEDIQTGAVDRPTMWAITDIETGEIIKEYETKEKEFSDAPYDVKYNVRSDAQYDTSKEYYDKAFAILDSVREKLISSGKLYSLEYKAYLDRILANIPQEYQRFYRDLSV